MVMVMNTMIAMLVTHMSGIDKQNILFENVFMLLFYVSFESIFWSYF